MTILESEKQCLRRSSISSIAKSNALHMRESFCPQLTFTPVSVRICKHKKFPPNPGPCPIIPLLTPLPNSSLTKSAD